MNPGELDYILTNQILQILPSPALGILWVLGKERLRKSATLQKPVKRVLRHLCGLVTPLAPIPDVDEARNTALPAMLHLGEKYPFALQTVCPVWLESKPV